MRVKMLTDAPGSPDGVTVNEYAEGEVYEVTDDLGAAFLAEDLAEVTGDDTTPDVEPEEVLTGDDAEDTKPSRRKVSAPAENK